MPVHTSGFTQLTVACLQVVGSRCLATLWSCCSPLVRPPFVSLSTTLARHTLEIAADPALVLPCRHNAVGGAGAIGEGLACIWAAKNFKSLKIKGEPVVCISG